MDPLVIQMDASDMLNLLWLASQACDVAAELRRQLPARVSCHDSCSLLAVQHASQWRMDVAIARVRVLYECEHRNGAFGSQSIQRVAHSLVEAVDAFDISEAARDPGVVVQVCIQPYEAAGNEPGLVGRFGGGHQGFWQGLGCAVEGSALKPLLIGKHLLFTTRLFMTVDGSVMRMELRVR